MPRSSEQTTTRRLSVLADILQAYTKIRRIIQAARAAGTPRGKLVDQLMLRCSSRDILVLREIRRRLQQQKRANQPWGNVSKKDDRMFKMLAKSVKRSDVHDHNYQYAINRFVKESFRCRALCVTSNRFGKAGFLPKAPVPQKKLPYRVYGYVGLKEAQRKHQLWHRQYLAWPSLPHLTPYKQKLSDTLLKERCSAGAFVRLQILTDVCHRYGSSLVQLPEKSLGTGVHFGLGVMDIGQLKQLKDILNERKYFRRLWNSSIVLHEVGHLVCEARQHVWRHKRKAAVVELMNGFASQKRRSEGSQEGRSEKRQCCKAIAEYAVQGWTKKCLAMYVCVHVCMYIRSCMYVNLFHCSINVVVVAFLVVVVVGGQQQQESGLLLICFARGQRHALLKRIMGLSN